MRFSLTTYNVLAQSYIKPERYVGIDPTHLAPRRRHALLLHTLGANPSDLIALQELEPAVFRDLQRALPAHEGVYEQRRGKPDGAAIFYRPDRFAMHRSFAIHYEACDPGYDHLALCLQAFDGTRKFTLASTHLRWNTPGGPPHRQLGRLQMQELLDTLTAEAWGDTLIAGDLNAPHDGSVIQAAAQANLHPCATNLEPWHTAFINGSPRKLDYVLVNPSRLQPRPRALPELSETQPAPSSTHASDHLPLTVDFSWS